MQVSAEREVRSFVERAKRCSYPIGGFDCLRSTNEKLRQICREVDLISDREIQHVVWADRHGIHRTGFERIAFAGITVDLIL